MSGPSDATFERLLGRVLRIGVTASSVCLAAGVLLAFSGNHGIGSILLTVGLVTLMMTPVARVAISIVDYSLRREWIFAALTTIVLLELCVAVVASLVFNKRL